MEIGKKGRFIYQLENENGETKVLTGITEVAEFLEVVESTISIKSDSGKYVNGWKIEKIGKTSGTTVTTIKQEVKIPRKRYLWNDWHFSTHKKNVPTIVLIKSYKIPSYLNVNYEKLEADVRKWVEDFIKGADFLEKKSIVCVDIPRHLNTKDIKQNLVGLELHFKFTEETNFSKQVLMLRDSILELDNLINNFS